MTFYVDPQGVAATNPSAPGMQSTVENWVNKARPSFDRLLQQGDAAMPKAVGMKPLQAPSVTSRGAGMLKNGMQTVKTLADPTPMIKAGIKGNAKALISLPAAAAGAGIAAAMDGLNTDTADYAKRIGVEEADPTQGNLIDKGLAIGKNTLIRGAGIAQDLGNNLTLGMGDRIGNAMAGNGFTRSDAYQDKPAAPSQPTPEKPALDPRSMPPTQLDKNDPNNPINQALAQPKPTSAQGIVRVNKPNEAPLYSDNPADPTAGMNTGLGMNGKVGNVSTVSIDKDAIARGNAAEQALYRAKVEAMDGRAPVEGGRSIVVGDPNAAAKENQARFESDLRQTATSKLSSKSEKRAALSALAQFSGDAASMENNANNNASALGMNRNNNATALQREQIEQQAKAPGMGLDNATKALSLQEQNQLAKLRADYMGLHDGNDPGGAKRKQLGAQLMTLQGKSSGMDNKFKVVELGGGNDSNGQPLPKTGYVFNQETGQYQPMQTQNTQAASPYAEGTELIGKDGNRYVVKNGQPVAKG